MAITSLSNFRTALARSTPLYLSKPASPSGTYAASLLTPGKPVAMVTPTTSLARSLSTAGSLPIPGGALNGLRLLQATISTVAPGVVVLCDLLNYQGGLVANSVAVQTTNLPTAALTRSTNGAGVLVAVEIFANIGSGTTYTSTYVNQDGATKTSKSSQLINTAGGVKLMSFADGDTGARSVTNFTIATSTGTAGNMGILLFKPLVVLATTAWGGLTQQDAISGGLQLETIPSDACLFLLQSGGRRGTAISFNMAEDV